MHIFFTLMYIKQLFNKSIISPKISASKIKHKIPTNIYFTPTIRNLVYPLP